MESLEGRVVLVAGGTGGVGEGIVAELLAQGARVVVQSRRQAALDGLAERLGPGARIGGVVAELGTDAGKEALRSAVAAHGVTAVVGSLGGFWQGLGVVDLPRAALDQVNDGGYLAHLGLAQAVLPVLSGPKAALVQINGLAALAGIPNSSALCISAAAQLALTRCLIVEAAADGPMIATFLIDQLVRTRAMQHLPDSALSPREIGSVVAAYLAAPDGHATRTLGKAEGRVTTRDL